MNLVALEMFAQAVRAGHKYHALGVAQIDRAPAGDHDLLARQDETETRDGFQYFQHRQRLVFLEGRSGDRIQDVHRHHVGADGFQFKGQVATVLARLAHPNDPAGADFDSGILQVTDGFKPVFKRVRGAMLREKAARTFQIVAVTFQARFF